MKALILTAGCSRRLRPLTDHTPKCLLSVAGEPILRRSIRGLLEQGIREFVVVTGFQAAKVRAAIAHWYPDLPVRFVHNSDFAATNNAYSLLLAKPQVAGSSFLLLDGDIIYDSEVVRGLIDHGGNCLALRSAGDIGLEEVKVRVDSRGQVVEIGKEVAVPAAAGESVGIELFDGPTSVRLFDMLKRRVIDSGRDNEYYEASFQAIIDNGVIMNVVDIGAYYAMEIDTRKDLVAANAMLLARDAKVRASRRFVAVA